MTDDNLPVSLEINFSHSESVNTDVVDSFYDEKYLHNTILIALDYMLNQQHQGVTFPYFSDENFNDSTVSKPFTIDVYLTDKTEARIINNDARGKDYATNILSYPSDLPDSMQQILPNIMLGELIICHEVVGKQANEQNKSTKHHLTHLLVHGFLHLLGFDHEVGEIERLEMEEFEINILNKLNISNPYITNINQDD